MWLEDVRCAGVDLHEYGRQELSLFSQSSWKHRRVSPEPYKCFDWKPEGWPNGENFDSGPYLATFTYGKDPEDWKLVWDFWVEEFAGEFFEMIEEQGYRVPGAWIDT